MGGGYGTAPIPYIPYPTPHPQHIVPTSRAVMMTTPLRMLTTAQTLTPDHPPYQHSMMMATPLLMLSTHSSGPSPGSSVCGMTDAARVGIMIPMVARKSSELLVRLLRALNSCVR